METLAVEDGSCTGIQVAVAVENGGHTEIQAVAGVVVEDGNRMEMQEGEKDWGGMGVVTVVVEGGDKEGGDRMQQVEEDGDRMDIQEAMGGGDGGWEPYRNTGDGGASKNLGASIW